MSLGWPEAKPEGPGPPAPTPAERASVATPTYSTLHRVGGPGLRVPRNRADPVGWLEHPLRRFASAPPHRAFRAGGGPGLATPPTPAGSARAFCEFLCLLWFASLPASHVPPHPPKAALPRRYRTRPDRRFASPCGTKRILCSDVPWVKLSGATRPWDFSCSVSSPTAAAARRPSSMSVGLSAT